MIEFLFMTFWLVGIVSCALCVHHFYFINRDEQACRIWIALLILCIFAGPVVTPVLLLYFLGVYIIDKLSEKIRSRKTRKVCDTKR